MCGFRVVATRYTSPESGLKMKIEYIKKYKTENGARQHCLNNYAHRSGHNLFERWDGLDQIIAEVRLDFSV